MYIMLDDQRHPYIYSAAVLCDEHRAQKNAKAHYMIMSNIKSDEEILGLFQLDTD